MPGSNERFVAWMLMTLATIWFWERFKCRSTFQTSAVMIWHFVCTHPLHYRGWTGRPTGIWTQPINTYGALNSL